MPSQRRTAPTLSEQVERLHALLAGRRTLVLSGAGLSTESGIPDYRGPDGRARAAAPVTFQAFVRDERARRRYWARSALGWPRMAGARPNAGHLAVTRLERVGALSGIVTQNVDGLHGRAGARDVLELHGALRSVCCLACGERTERAKLQRRLVELNPWVARVGGGRREGGRVPGDRAPAGRADMERATVDRNGADRADAIRWAPRPDGDAELSDARAEAFRVPDCRRCGGLLKPDVVFFGENIPADVVQGGWERLAEAEAVLVVGSSLAVRSAYRLVRAAAEAGTPVAIVNDGPTRGDAHAAVRLHARLGVALPALAERWSRA